MSQFISVEELQSSISSYIAPYLANKAIGTTKRPLLECLGHICATDISAPFSLPRQDVSAMDGYALLSGTKITSGTSFEVIGESVAGKAFTPSKSDQVSIAESTQALAVRIMTGAVVPDGFDTVVMQENTERNGEVLTLTKDAKPKGNIRFVGEEITRGEVLLPQGTIIAAKHISLLAAMGYDQLDVKSPIKVGIISSGDELVPIGGSLENLTQIYDSNSPAIRSLLQDMPVELKDYGIVKDDFEQTKTVLQQVASECDIVISSAGVSVGDYDYFTDAIEALGKIHQYKIRMKPGKPFVFGEIGLHNPSVYFGLPGNPLSTFIGALLIIKPALWQYMGVKDIPQPLMIEAKAVKKIKKRAGRRDFQRGILSQTAVGQWQVEPVGPQDSHRVKGLTLANCLMDLPEESSDIAEDEHVCVLPLSNPFI